MELPTFGVMASQTFTNYNLLCHVLTAFGVERVVSSGVTNLDKLVELYAKTNNLPIIRIERTWVPGKYAALERNTLILDRCHAVICFCSNNSKRLKDMISKTERSGKQVFIIHC